MYYLYSILIQWMPHEQTGVNSDTAIDTLLCFVHDITVTGTRKRLKSDPTVDNKKQKQQQK